MTEEDFEFLMLLCEFRQYHPRAQMITVYMEMPHGIASFGKKKVTKDNKE